MAFRKLPCKSYCGRSGCYIDYDRYVCGHTTGPELDMDTGKPYVAPQSDPEELDHFMDVETYDDYFPGEEG